MSRIHDALLKAERERRGEAPPPAVQEVVPSMSEPEAAPAAAVGVAEEPGPVTAPEVAGAAAVLARAKATAWKPNQKAVLPADAQRVVPGIEEFRTLRSRLYQLRSQGPLKVVLIASAMPGEGKSFVAVNLAQIFVRQRGRRVLLIDGDLRWPRLHEALGAPATPGLAECLRGEADVMAALQRGPGDALFFLPGGAAGPNPAEIIANGRLKGIMEQLRPLFDWIVIDTPAAVPISDANILANYCDGVVLVVRAGETPFDLARKAREEFQHKPVLGAVLNRVKAGATYSSYYYKGYKVDEPKG